MPPFPTDEHFIRMAADVVVYHGLWIAAIIMAACVAVALIIRP